MEFWATKPNLAESRLHSTRVPSIISAVSARTTMGKQLQNISVFQQQQQVQEIWKFIRLQEEEEEKKKIKLQVSVKGQTKWLGYLRR